MIARGNLGYPLSLKINQAHEDGASETDILSFFRPELIRLAKIGRSRGASHRGLLTGGSVLFRVTNQPRGLDFYVAEVLHNWSPYEGDPKSCSEMGAGEEAEILQSEYGVGPVRGSGLVVVTPKDSDVIESVLGVRMPTMIPCHDCGDVIAANPTAFPEKMPVTTVGVGENRNDQLIIDFTVGDVLGILASLPRPQSSLELMASSGATAL